MVVTLESPTTYAHQIVAVRIEIHPWISVSEVSQMPCVYLSEIRLHGKKKISNALCFWLRSRKLTSCGGEEDVVLSSRIFMFSRVCGKCSCLLN